MDESGTTTFAYDRRGLVVSQSVVGSTADETGTLAYRHDAAGREVEVTYPSTDKIQSVRNAAGRVTTLTWVPPVGSSTTILSSITHKPFGPVTGFVTSGGATETRTYDTRYRRQSQSTVSGGVTRLSLAYDDGAVPPVGWDKEGNLLHLRDTTPGSGTAFDRTFGYDPDRYFLTSSSGPYGPSWDQQTLSWTYDPNGNRLTEERSKAGTTIYTYGNDGASHSNGVLTSVTPPGGSQAQLTSLSTGDLSIDDDGLLHEYDALGRLTRVIRPIGDGCFPLPAVATFKHDARNLRTLASYIPCGLVSPAMQVENAFHGPDGSLLFLRESQPVFILSADQVHVWLEGEPVALVARGTTRRNQFERLTFLHGDHLGRPIGMTDSTGALVWRPEYEPFGKSLAPRTNTIPGPGFRFPGQWESRLSADLPGGDTTPLGRIAALTDNWHRTYVQRWGRYTQPDPIGLEGGLNLFSYVQANPLRLIDPDGLQANCCDCPEQLWSYSGASMGLAFIGGRSKFKGTYTCSSKPSLQVDVEGECRQIGLFFGAGASWEFSMTPFGLPGAKACKADELISKADPTRPSFFGSVGILFGQGNFWSGTGTVALGPGMMGVGAQGCTTKRSAPRPRWATYAANQR